MAQTRLLAGDLMNSIVKMGFAAGQQNTDCAAAQDAPFRGYGFARYVRTKVEQEGGLWREDAVYTHSPALPRGVRKNDANEVVANAWMKGDRRSEGMGQEWLNF
ncbi:hypothetical protein [Actibacterium lipolyticum]|uniref:Uncharacterized protein n=1 Tax=Actibacterium lipolyticum TaxID=1524263 RepID=A0A238JU02_9RHOB|nr:hypothetical protein [Actibacterium lipolyticum]SMX34121.1 hypothetical protein COL8621_01185 [Actibacterium lipolyticum]